MKTSKYQQLLDRTPPSIRYLAEEAYCIGYEARLQCERTVAALGRDCPTEVYNQNDRAFLREHQAPAAQLEKYAREDTELTLGIRSTNLAEVAKRLKREHDEADAAFLTRLKHMQEVDI